MPAFGNKIPHIWKMPDGNDCRLVWVIPAAFTGARRLLPPDCRLTTVARRPLPPDYRLITVARRPLPLDYRLITVARRPLPPHSAWWTVGIWRDPTVFFSNPAAILHLPAQPVLHTPILQNLLKHTNTILTNASIDAFTSCNLRCCLQLWQLRALCLLCILAIVPCQCNRH
mgnify:CR=1 FL=1